MSIKKTRKQSKSSEIMQDRYQENVLNKQN